jgi:hypothetical protein
VTWRVSYIGFKARRDPPVAPRRSPIGACQFHRGVSLSGRAVEEQEVDDVSSRSFWQSVWSTWWGEKAILVMMATLVIIMFVQFIRGEYDQVSILSYSCGGLTVLSFALKFWRSRRQPDGSGQR